MGGGGWVLQVITYSAQQSATITALLRSHQCCPKWEKLFGGIDLPNKIPQREFIKIYYFRKELFRHATFLPEVFRQTTFYVSELIQQATF